jgi:serine/threonine protein kinase
MQISKKGLDSVNILKVLLEVAQGMAAAHALGITNRDLKPSSVLVDKDNNVKLVDWGMASFSGRAPVLQGTVKCPIGTARYGSLRYQTSCSRSSCRQSDGL